MTNTALATRWPRLGLSFNDIFEPWSEWFQDGALSKTMTVPNVNITEDKSSYNLSLAAPGLAKKDFKIEVEGNMLTISAKKEENKEEKEGTFTRKEYNYASFSRSFTLPEVVAQDKVEATYADGILKMTLPKNDIAAKQLRKAINIK